MAIFNPTPFFKKKNPIQENYLALTITPEKVLALIWAFVNSQVQILGYFQTKYQNSQNLVHQAAVAIDSASEEARSDVSQVVFGLSANFFDDGQISQDALKLLESMSADLELKARAFVPLSVAIKNYLKDRETAAPQAVLLGIFENLLEAHLIKNNQIAASTSSKTKPTPEKIKELIAGLEAKESLPARIVVFGEKPDANIIEKLPQAHLNDLFTQEPRIDSIDDRNLAEAVAFAQAADIFGHEVAPQVSRQTRDKVTKSAKEPDEFGFVEGEDILKQEPRGSAEEEQETTKSQQIEETKIAPQTPSEISLKPEQKPPDQSPKRSILDQILTLSWLEKLSAIAGKKGASQKIAIALIAFVAVYLVANLILSGTITRANVTISVKSQPQEENFSAKVIEDGDPNFDAKQIAGQTIAASASGSQKGVPTGKKKLGNNAKGDITVFNWTTSQVSFPAQTTIISSGGVKFNLDSSVAVASRSAAQPGQTHVSVTAADFGSIGNLSSGTDLSFQKYDELLYSARNESAFAGGDEKEVTVVSGDDMDKLAKSLTADLKDKALQNLKSSNPDKAINGDAITIEVTKKQFDKNVDEEATLFNLDMEVTASVITYEQSTLNELLASVANQNAPQDLYAKGENIEILSLNSKASKGKLNLAGRFRANLIPKFDENDLKNKIAGKSEKQTREILLQVPQISDVSVNFSPGSLLAPKIPKKADRVTIKIETAI